MALAPKPVYVRRRVVTVCYFADPKGQLRPTGPDCCADLDSVGPCLIKFHQWRSRKTGPGYPLASFACRPHHCFFTAYPESWLPYGRRAMAMVTHSGLDVICRESGLDLWIETAFGASVDASFDRAWPKSSGGKKAWFSRFGREPYGVLRTQLRHVGGVNRLNIVARLPHAWTL